MYELIIINSCLNQSRLRSSPRIRRKLVGELMKIYIKVVSLFCTGTNFCLSQSRQRSSPSTRHKLVDELMKVSLYNFVLEYILI